MTNLRSNQNNAINASINNDFASGIHYHATGSGKSWIAMYLILKFSPDLELILIWIFKKILQYYYN